MFRTMIREIVMEERLVSAEAIVRYIKNSARLTAPMATLMARV